MSKMKRRTIAILVLIFVVALVARWPWIRMIGKADRFLDEATTILGTGSEHPGIVKITLKSGDSFRALLEHSCCSGGGFAAVAIQTSDGSVYHSRNNYCGEEGFYAVMTEREFGSLPELENYLLENGYTKTGQNTGRLATASPSPAT